MEVFQYMSHPLACATEQDVELIHDTTNREDMLQVTLQTDRRARRSGWKGVRRLP